MDIKGNSLLSFPAPVPKFLFMKQELYERETPESGFAGGSCCHTGSEEGCVPLQAWHGEVAE